MVRIHLNWYGKDDMKVNFFSQWREIGALYLTPKKMSDTGQTPRDVFSLL